MILDGARPEAIAQAVDALAAGRLVGLPTETVYGLAADAGNAAAVRAIFATKGRPADHPLIVHVAGAAAVPAFASAVPDFAQRLIDACWPGPLTLILPRRPGVADAAAGGHPSIGLRCPAHPVARALLAACAARGIAGLAAPSANRFGRVSPTTAAHVAAEFGDELLVLDGGACNVGIESTIIDATRGAPVLLRPGQLARADIERLAGRQLLSKEELMAPDPQAPGTLSAHYAPTARLRLMDARELRAALQVLGAEARHIAVWARAPLTSASRQLLLRRMPERADAAARELFAVLREFDAAGARLIWVETPPDDPAWDGVRDRLQRAAASA
ncbi:MAG: threonylcarbamoyl-AMP synthase [Rubrivivax sp.]|uniref:L-threonylcarbamoyladenylate synthase n=1 Tax=Ottowia sp. TaxID=1898956 RepID=UPI00217B51D3|nr:L-threonylcarbamoyladenylate synthase [Ottowia sp.]MCC6813634.1 threonylcarbamoyl-AMP synthase [Rubrivivax sp.]HNR82602.1 L-threonylcarbamoyladenylate synthase [Ottowia sp.]HNT84479.1 L-threonylcarbamoyladenylate synthase [Ottowia sp.]HOZ93779.1 L-threonylcarbamoyladenylate synthase [Ottowia sp.]HQQ53167.1 L-threonylcarbamoyladenylate synthase [Ottowia sp.]